MFKKLWRHFYERVVKDQRGVVPLISSIGYALAGLGGAGAIGYGLFGRKKKRQEVEDPLAAIRQQLVALAETGYPTEEIKRMIGERFREREKRGFREIGEEIYAEKQVPGTIQASLVTDLLKQLGGEEEAALLETDIAGRRFKLNALQAALGYAPPAAPEEEPGLWETLLPAGAELAGQYMGQRAYTKDIEELLASLKKETPTPTAGKGAPLLISV